jgi:hypothetical protein
MVLGAVNKNIEINKKLKNESKTIRWWWHDC